MTNPNQDKLTPVKPAEAQPSDAAPPAPNTPLEMVAAMCTSLLPGKRIIVLVDDGSGQVGMAGMNLSGVDRLGLLEAGSLLAKTEFAQGIRVGMPAPVQSEMKTAT